MLDPSKYTKESKTQLNVFHCTKIEKLSSRARDSRKRDKGNEQKQKYSKERENKLIEN